MKQKHTRSKKARRLNDWAAYQKWQYGLSVFWRRVRGMYGADHAEMSEKRPDLDRAVDGYKARLAIQSNGVHQKGM